jgi:hypothetical protein
MDLSQTHQQSFQDNHFYQTKPIQSKKPDPITSAKPARTKIQSIPDQKIQTLVSKSKLFNQTVQNSHNPFIMLTQMTK